MALRRGRPKDPGPSEKTITVAQLRAATESAVREIEETLRSLSEELAKGDAE